MSGKVVLPTGDPRRPDDAKAYPRLSAEAEEDNLPIMFVVSMFVSLAGFLLKHKVLSWLAVYTCAAGMANLKGSSGVQHIISATMFAMMGLVATYTHTGPRGLAAIFPQHYGAAAAGGAPPAAAAAGPA